MVRVSSTGAKLDLDENWIKAGPGGRVLMPQTKALVLHSFHGCNAVPDDL